MKIVNGKPDTEFASIYKQIVDYHQLKNPYWSHDLKNDHFIRRSTEHCYELGSKQYLYLLYYLRPFYHPLN